jgi:hypothetical protein
LMWSFGVNGAVRIHIPHARAGLGNSVELNIFRPLAVGAEIIARPPGWYIGKRAGRCLAGDASREPSGARDEKPSRQALRAANFGRRGRRFAQICHLNFLKLMQWANPSPVGSGAP